MSFGLSNRVGTRNRAYGRHLANTTGQSVFCGDEGCRYQYLNNLLHFRALNHRYIKPLGLQTGEVNVGVL